MSGNVGYLLERYGEHPQTLALVEAVGTPRGRVLVRGVVGAQKALVAAALTRRSGRLVLWVGNGKEESAYLYNDLQGLMGPNDVCFFPDSFRSPAAFEHLNTTQVLQRSEVVNRLTLGERRGWVTVTYPEALFERVIAPDVLAQSRIEIGKGERLDLDFLLQVLVEYGFERSDFVYEPGQFSVRGGIVDLFSFGNEYPYRIELMDEEVESIRLFDPLTQLSRQTVERVGVVPNWETLSSKTEKSSLLQALPEGAIIWIEDLQFLLDRLLHCFEAAERYAAQLSILAPEEVSALLKERAFVRPAELLGDLPRFTLIFSTPPPEELRSTLSAHFSVD